MNQNELKPLLAGERQGEQRTRQTHEGNLVAPPADLHEPAPQPPVKPAQALPPWARSAWLSQALQACASGAALLPCDPRVEREFLRPAAFPNLKAPVPPAVRLPTAGVKAARLIEVPQYAWEDEKAASAETELAPAAGPIAASDDPLWYSLFAPRPDEIGEGERKRHEVVSFPLSAETAAETPYVRPQPKRKKKKRKDGVEDDFDSPLPFRPVPSRRRAWQTVEGVFLSRSFSQLVAAVIIVLFVSTLDVPWRQWFNRQVQRFKEPIVVAMDTLSRPVRERAAFFIVDDFSAGFDHWVNNVNLDAASNGLIAVKPGIALHEGTLDLQNYRLDLEARIESRAVGWAVRARDTGNLYAMKLEEVRRRSGSSFNLLRWAVTGGNRQNTVRVPLPAEIARSGQFNRISVRVRDDQFTTLINGWGVDFWRDDRFQRGGVGLLADAGESALVRRLTVSGNEDAWGLILYGTLETMRSVQETISPPAAILLQPSPLSLSPVYHLRGAAE